MTAWITAIISSILSIIDNISEYYKNVSKDKTVIDNTNSKKLQEEIDNHTLVITDAQETKNLDEIRKEASE